MVDLAKFALAAFLPRPSTELDSPVPERTPRPEPEPEPEPERSRRSPSPSPSPPEAVASGGLASGGLAQTHRRAQTQRRPNSAEAGPEPEPEPDLGGFEDARNRTDSRRADAIADGRTRRPRRQRPERTGFLSCCGAPTPGDGN
eukprot:COSAG04_NODE_702_length_11009_cov_109.493217_7_plen_144_part_00